MKLRLDSAGDIVQPLPNDLTGHTITIDLRNVDTEKGAAAAVLIRELLDRGAARLVIAEDRGVVHGGARTHSGGAVSADSGMQAA